MEIGTNKMLQRMSKVVYTKDVYNSTPIIEVFMQEWFSNDKIERVQKANISNTKIDT